VILIFICLTISYKYLFILRDNNITDVELYTWHIVVYTVKPAHAATSIKQLPVLKVIFFLSCHSRFHMN